MGEVRRRVPSVFDSQGSDIERSCHGCRQQDRASRIWEPSVERSC
ncbi:TPA: hypothetical protein N0F65_002609 [Lagenidium giganteum]|uniref:Uncharacterized protein n=1 Tax=Lagenidium giganteum TaxID=4803 RepID=A0AAV2YZY1_9STRA|nr:TPA: hypothetical protein N0F65_002609 [Lagenidium giganteum]